MFRQLRTFSSLSNKAALFEGAVEAVKKLSAKPSNDKLLSLYALFKQASVGDCVEPSPSLLQLKDRAKWEAWTKLKGTSKYSAKESYVNLVVSLGGDKYIPGLSNAAPEVEAPIVLVDVKDNVCTITMNRPKRYNAFTSGMMINLAKALKTAESSDARVAVLTGAGSYFTSGNDISNFLSKDPPAVAAKNAAQALKAFVGALIDFPKPLIAAVNGPAIGIGVTALGLCDFVYASDKATFSTPFTSLGLCPEGCSSYTFPQILGPIRANELLLGGRKWSAHEALQHGLLTAVYEDALFAKTLQSRVNELSNLPAHSLCVGKSVLRATTKETMHRINEIECEAVERQWQAKDCQDAVAAFLKRKA